MISVIMPVYNKEKYVSCILHDLESQTYADFECIIVDDGSTDKSGEICDDFARHDKRFIVKHIVNGGVSHARNIALDCAVGEYIIFVDADDRISSNLLEKLEESIVNNDSDMAISPFIIWWENCTQEEFKIWPYAGKIILKDHLESYAAVQKDTGMFGYCCGKLIKKNSLGNIRFDESLKLAEDVDLYLRLYPNIDTISFPADCYYKYLQQADNSSFKIPDSEIDYYSQLIINLRYKRFLINAQAWTGQNKEIVCRILSNYVFFTVFHSERKKVKERVRLLHDIVEAEALELFPENTHQKVILPAIKSGNWILAKIWLMVYDIARCLLRRGSRK